MPFVAHTLKFADWTLTAFGLLFGVLALWSWGAYWLGAGATQTAAQALLFTVACVGAFALSMGVERLRGEGE
jgi:hypothetical protein